MDGLQLNDVLFAGVSLILRSPY